MLCWLLKVAGGHMLHNVDIGAESQDETFGKELLRIA
jgi:hypothetical protein